MERNYDAAKHSQVRPSHQLYLIFPPFPVGHPDQSPSIIVQNMSLKFPPKQNFSGISTDQLLVFEKRLEGGGDVAAEVVPLEAVLGRVARRPGGHPGVTEGHFWVTMGPSNSLSHFHNNTIPSADFTRQKG